MICKSCKTDCSKMDIGFVFSNREVQACSNCESVINKHINRINELERVIKIALEHGCNIQCAECFHQLKTALFENKSIVFLNPPRVL